MRLIYPAIADNPKGANPENSIYIAINKLFPALGLNQTNSKIIDTQPAALPTSPNMKRVLVEKDNDYEKRYDFFYECYLLENVFVNPLFTASEIAAVQAIKTSAKLLEYIQNKFGRNLPTKDFWVSDTSIDYTGGEKRPNFCLEAVSTAQWYTGSTIIHLWV